VDKNERESHDSTRNHYDSAYYNIAILTN
jgi:hypothetical protein